MLDLVDLLLLRRGIPADDRELTFRRIDGNASSKVLYFLPWHTPFGIARQIGIMPLDFLACYEMPAAIVSSEPDLCLRAMVALVTDAQRLLTERGGIAGKDVLVVGLSVGSYPATYLANRIGARLCSVHPRIALIWPSGRVRQRASSSTAPYRKDMSFLTTPRLSMAPTPRRTLQDLRRIACL
jgi:hypothetical protein